MPSSDKTSLEIPDSGKATTPLSPSNRLPRPYLFQGPPSRNASTLSLQPPGLAAAAVGLPSTHVAALDASQRSPSQPSGSGAKDTSHASITPENRATANGIKNRMAVRDEASYARNPNGHAASRGSLMRHATDARVKREHDDRADELWAKMQATLAEVEVSAANGSRIFGEGHAKALEELRDAQLGLARAWTMSTNEKESEQDANAAGKAHEDDRKSTGNGSVKVEPSPRNTKTGTQAKDSSPTAGDSRRSSQDNGTRIPKTLEEQTEHDIQLAKKRREANDRYFNQVNDAVGDLVAKLDRVADAMKHVEQESRDIWSEDEEGNDSNASEELSVSTPNG